MGGGWRGKWEGAVEGGMVDLGDGFMLCVLK